MMRRALSMTGTFVMGRMEVDIVPFDFKLPGKDYGGSWRSSIGKRAKRAIIASESARRIARPAQILRCAKALAQDDSRTVSRDVISRTSNAIENNISELQVPEPNRRADLWLPTALSRRRAMG
jgi:hypothetical protein